MKYAESPSYDNLKGRRSRGGMKASAAAMDHMSKAAKECGLSVDSMSVENYGDSGPSYRMSFRKKGKGKR